VKAAVAFYEQAFGLKHTSGTKMIEYPSFMAGLLDFCTSNLGCG
jgi:predicted enzyme related to lactoylglutathione lyase